ncbi:MAG: hypothetical protein Q4B48_06445 [Syntrophomonadaceae bacterium]|nr:hypothetical protein [Syntrophomonadaceae bacterium]
MSKKARRRHGVALLLAALLMTLSAGCEAPPPPESPEITADSVAVYYGFHSYALFSSQEDTVRQLVDIYNGLSFEPAAEDMDMDMGSMLSIVYSRDDRRVAELAADANGVFRLSGDMEDLTETTGTFDYELVKAIYDGANGTDGQYAVETPPDDAVVTPPVYDPAAVMGDEEFVTARGVRLAMTYDQVLALLGAPDQAFDYEQEVKTFNKDGVRYGFYLINEGFPADYPLPRDGQFYLLDLSVGAECPDPLPREISIGDDIAAVLDKFPAQDKTLKEWAMQTVYGQPGSSQPYAFLTFAVADASYRLCAVSGGNVMNVYFDPQHQVSKIEFNYEP